MNIQPINNYSVSYNSRQHTAQKMLPYSSVGFQAKIPVSDDFATPSKNPIVKYAYDIFKRSLIASARNIMPITPELKPITKEVPLKVSSKEKTYAWDIENKIPDKYVLYLHGASQNITNIQNLYKSIIDNTDFSVLALEYRGFGRNHASKISSHSFEEDVNSALSYLENEKRIKEENIFVVGHSMGSYLAALIASKKPNLGRLVLVAPLGSVAEHPFDVNFWFTKRMPPLVKFLFKNFKILRRPLTNFFKIENHIKKSQVPTDIIHAQNDRLIKYKSSEKIATLCPNLHSLQILKHGGHKMEGNKINTILSILRGE